MKKIQFSVLMSVYFKDKGEYLKMAIDSIINQTVLPNEFIIVKDGPLNKEIDLILEEYERNYKWIKTISLEKNSGLGVALREGIKYCKCEYVARMDADDYSVPNRFEEQINYIQKNPSIDLLGGYIQEYDESLKKTISVRQVPLEQKDIKKFAKTRNPFNHVSVIFKKDSVLSCGNYEGMLYFEDYYLWCKMISNNCNVANMNKILVNVRAGEAFFKRRGGLAYSKAVINFERNITKLGIIGKLECIKLSFIKIIVTILPPFVRKFIYMKKLRKQ